MERRRKFKIVFEFETDATSPLEAAKQTEEMIKNSKGAHWTWIVEDVKYKTIYGVDLDINEDNAVYPAIHWKPLINPDK